MKVPFKIIEIINIIALLFLLAGGYGLAITGILQVFTAILFLVTFPKNKLIYIYFGLVIIFFLIWDQHTIGWLLLPLFLMLLLTFIIYKQKKQT